MTASEKLVSAFANALQIAPEAVIPALSYQSIPQWDSISHMVLIAELEAAFEIAIDTDDVIDMSSVAKAQEIIAKHGITF
jgi:acyl carrier protein